MNPYSTEQLQLCYFYLHVNIYSCFIALLNSCNVLIYFDLIVKEALLLIQIKITFVPRTIQYRAMRVKFVAQWKHQDFKILIKHAIMEMKENQTQGYKSC